MFAQNYRNIIYYFVCRQRIIKILLLKWILINLMFINWLENIIKLCYYNFPLKIIYNKTTVKFNLILHGPNQVTVTSKTPPRNQALRVVFRNRKWKHNWVCMCTIPHFRPFRKSCRPIPVWTPEPKAPSRRWLAAPPSSRARGLNIDPCGNH